jgi:hypothetical protein
MVCFYLPGLLNPYGGNLMMKTKLEALKLLLEAYVEMNRMKACEPGEKSHALWNSTEFVKRQISMIVKDINELEEYV